VNLSGADMQMQEMQDRLTAVTAERDAAVSALRMNAGSKGSTTVMMSLDRWQEHLALVERYGADQWRRGNAGKDPQDFEEWRQGQP